MESYLLCRFDLVSFLLGQFKQGIANAQLADPDSFRFSRAVLSTKAVEATLDKIHGASRPVAWLANSQAQKAHSQRRSRPFVPPCAISPPHSFEPRNGNCQGKPYQASGGMTVPAGGKSRSARISSCPYLKESNTLPRSSPTLNASGHCFSCSMIRSGRLTLPCTDSRNARSTRVTSSSVSLCSSL